MFLSGGDSVSFKVSVDKLTYPERKLWVNQEGSCALDSLESLQVTPQDSDKVTIKGISLSIFK